MLGRFLRLSAPHLSLSDCFSSGFPRGCGQGQVHKGCPWHTWQLPSAPLWVICYFFFQPDWGLSAGLLWQHFWRRWKNNPAKVVLGDTPNPSLEEKKNPSGVNNYYFFHQPFIFSLSSLSLSAVPPSVSLASRFRAQSFPSLTECPRNPSTA